MSEMVERVARAIKDAEQMHWNDMARVAIAAMKDPSDRMCNSGAAAWEDDLCTESNALNIWRAMVDEALK